MSTHAIGIDFTTGRPVPVRLGRSRDLIPTAVHISKDGSWLFGEDSDDMRISEPDGIEVKHQHGWHLLPGVAIHEEIDLSVKEADEIMHGYSVLQSTKRWLTGQCGPGSGFETDAGLEQAVVSEYRGVVDILVPRHDLERSLGDHLPQ